MIEITDDQIGYAAIKEASRSQTLSSYPFDQMSVGFGFEKGAKWMQEQIKPEWIDVNDRLPETDGIYLTLDRFNDVNVSGYVESYFTDIDAEYWMPLPDAPTA